MDKDVSDSDVGRDLLVCLQLQGSVAITTDDPRDQRLRFFSISRSLATPENY